MAVFSDRLLNTIIENPGLTDRDLTDRLKGRDTHPSQVNQECRHLASTGKLLRKKRDDGKIGNYPFEGDHRKELIAPQSSMKNEVPPVRPVPQLSIPGSEDPTLGESEKLVDVGDDPFAEDNVKRVLVAWLSGQGWSAKVAWGREPGPDIVATRGNRRWKIEVKGRGKYDAMKHNYFLGALGTLLTKMDDPDAQYSVAFPSLKKFRNLWSKLPLAAKERTKISALFVDDQGQVEWLT